MPSQRIAFVHSFYRSQNPSGENAVVRAEVAALRRAGYVVELFSESTDDLASEPLYRMRTAARVASGRGRDPLSGIRAFDPDVIHVHNLFPNYGREWVRDVEVPLVVTLHNYRPLCAKATLFRDGHICTLCPDGARWSGVRYACYRGSRLATVPLAWANRHGAGSDPVLERADVVIVLSEQMRTLYENDGLDAQKITVLPNFLLDELDPGLAGTPPPPGAPWLFAGRLDEAKGIMQLLDFWPASHVLRVVGDGPLRDAVSQAVGHRPEIELLGTVPRRDVLDMMHGSVGLVFPSRWFEGFPMIYVEALAAGLPVLAFRPNVVSNLVVRDSTGFVATWSKPLVEQLDRAAREFSFMRETCREVFATQFSETIHVERKAGLYGRLTRGYG